MTAQTATQRYYARIHEVYGYADSRMRGTGHNLIHVHAISKVPAEPQATAYCKDGARARIGTTRENRIDKVQRSVERERRADGLLSDLRTLVHDTRKRIGKRACHAARDALADAEALLTGQRPLSRAHPDELLPALILILRRWA